MLSQLCPFFSGRRHPNLNCATYRNVSGAGVTTKRHYCTVLALYNIGIEIIQTRESHSFLGDVYFMHYFLAYVFGTFMLL